MHLPLRLQVPLALALGLGAVVAGAACGDGDAESSASSASGGAGGGGGATSSSSTGGPFALCQSKAVGLQGSLDGDPVEASFPIVRTRIKGSLWQAFFHTQGHVALFGEGDLEMPGASSNAIGVFRMPEEGPSGGEWFCAGSGSKATNGDQKTFSLAAVARLGACGGAPVDGEIDGCFGPDASLCPLGTKLTSSLKGAEFDWTSAVTGWAGMPGLYEIFLDNGGILALYIELDAVLGGLLYIAPGSPDEGAVYCFGGGALQPGSQNAIKFTLTGLSRVGTCAGATAVEGSLEGCAQ